MVVSHSPWTGDHVGSIPTLQTKLSREDVKLALVELLPLTEQMIRVAVGNRLADNNSYRPYIGREADGTSRQSYKLCSSPGSIPGRPTKVSFMLLRLASPSEYNLPGFSLRKQSKNQF